jgi:hypothetical protein
MPTISGVSRFALDARLPLELVKRCKAEADRVGVGVDETLAEAALVAAAGALLGDAPGASTRGLTRANEAEALALDDSLFFAAEDVLGEDVLEAECDARRERTPLADADEVPDPLKESCALGVNAAEAVELAEGVDAGDGVACTEVPLVDVDVAVFVAACVEKALDVRLALERAVSEAEGESDGEAVTVTLFTLELVPRPTLAVIEIDTSADLELEALLVLVRDAEVAVEADTRPETVPRRALPEDLTDAVDDAEGVDTSEPFSELDAEPELSDEDVAVAEIVPPPDGDGPAEPEREGGEEKDEEGETEAHAVEEEVADGLKDGLGEPVELSVAAPESVTRLEAVAHAEVLAVADEGPEGVGR